MTIASKALHKSKQNLGPIFKLCCARDSMSAVLRTHFVEHFTRLIEDLSFFFDIK